jgi:competence protein ComEC
MVMIIFANYLIKDYSFNQFTSLEYAGYAKIYKTVECNDYQKIYIKTKQGKLYFNSNEKIYRSGMIIYTSGSIELPYQSHYKHGFNFSLYLKYNSIYGKFKISEISVVKKRFSLFNIHEKLNDYINRNFTSPNKEFLKTLIIGDKNTFDEELYSQIQNLGIAHLFVISGLHIDIIKKFSMKILNFLRVNEIFQTLIILVLLLMYFVVAMFSVSILEYY